MTIFFSSVLKRGEFMSTYLPGELNLPFRPFVDKLKLSFTLLGLSDPYLHFGDNYDAFFVLTFTFLNIFMGFTLCTTIWLLSPSKGIASSRSIFEFNSIFAFEFGEWSCTSNSSGATSFGGFGTAGFWFGCRLLVVIIFSLLGPVLIVFFSLLPPPLETIFVWFILFYTSSAFFAFIFGYSFGLHATCSTFTSLIGFCVFGPFFLFILL